MPRPAAALTRPHRQSARLLVLALALLLAVPLAGGVAAAGTAAPGAAPTDLQQAEQRVQSAQQQVEALQAQVEQTAAVLDAGTARLEAGQAELARTRAAQAAAEVAAGAAAVRAAEAKQKVALVVSAAYRSPVPQTLQMALTAGPEQIVDVIVARHDLDRVSGDSQDLLARATAARVEAEQARRYATSLTQQAAEQEAALAVEVDRLAAIARQSQATLAVAAADLATAQSAQQGALAAADAEQRARAAAGSIVATCAGMPTGPQANGLLDPSTLCPLDDAPGHALRPDAATAFGAMNAAHKAERGSPLCVGDSYRSYAAQVAVYAAKPALAAVPGRSNHGWGLAVDFGCGVQSFGTPAHEWMRANAVRFGWFHPAWAQAGGSRPEAWHWEFAGGQS